MFRNKKAIGNHTRKKLTFVAKSGRKQKKIPIVIGKRKSQATPFIKAFSFLTSGQSSSGLSSTVFQPTIDSELLLSYKERRIELSKSWRQIEPKLLNIGSQYFYPASFECCVCNCKVPNIIRCLDCGPNVYYCNNCVEDKHTYTVFHRPDIWKETIFVKLQLMQKVLKRIDVHECSFHDRTLTVIDGKGFQHELSIEFCQCESDAETLLRHNFWPCSVAAPKVAVSTEFLEMLRVLSMEKQISTEGFCNALNNRYIKIPGYYPKIKNLSKILLNEVMESYRHHVYQLSHLSHLKVPGIDDGSCCPSCDGIPGDKMFCLDGNFGLVRRVAAGPQSIEPHHKNLFFADQQNVDEFVANYDDPKIGEDCSNFQAGSTIRSKGKNKKLDIKGVFGSCCKHEIPKIFLDLKHGEKLGYPIWLIKHLLQSRNTSKLKIFYDIACRLKKHLMIKNDSVLLSQVAYAVPVFHGYGHNFACQMKFSPRRKVGFGLTEGETVERLWSYLRNCNKITKEMKPEHRTDFLTDSLLHYTQRIKQKIGNVLKQRMTRATAVLNDSMETLKPLHFISSDIMNDQLTREHEQISDEKYSWEEEYCMKLYTLHQQRKTLITMEENSNDNVAEQFGEVARQEKKISQFEKKQGISSRWTDVKLQNYLQSGVHKFRKTLLFKIQKANFERLFCSTLIKKYPAGQTVAKRIFANLNRMSKSIKKMISRYNIWHNIDGGANLPNKITWQEMVIGKYTSSDADDLQSATSLQVVTNAYNLSLRAKEEILFIKEEMMSTMVFYQQQITILNKWQSEFSEHARAQLLTHQLQLELRLKALNRDFQQFVKVSINTPLCDDIGMELQSENVVEFVELDNEEEEEEMDEDVEGEECEDTDDEPSD